MASRYRGECLERDGYVCRNCGARATHAHHIVPVAARGLDTLSNLAALCDDCHGRVHGVDFTDHSALTKAGLQKARERGVKLGGTGGTHAALLQRNKNRKIKRDQFVEQYIEEVTKLRSEGKTLRDIAKIMNDCGYASPEGKQWTPTTVHRVIRRYRNQFTNDAKHTQ
jgi:hypothetical protein